MSDRLGITDELNAAEIVGGTGRDCAFNAIEVHQLVGSTNALVRERAAAGAPEGLVAVASEQTVGRGRKGRSFFSPGGT